MSTESPSNPTSPQAAKPHDYHQGLPPIPGLPEYPPGQIPSGPPYPRPKPMVYSNGRKAVLQMIDMMLSKEENIQLIRQDFQRRLEENPSEFFHGVVQPLIPNSMLEDKSGEESAEDKASKLRAALAEMDGATAGTQVHVHVHNAPSTPSSPPASTPDKGQGPD